MMKERIQNILLGLKVSITRWKTYRPFMAATTTARQVQLDLLKELLQANAATRFGQEHGFSGIQSPEDYAQAVSIQGYDSLQPYIEEQSRDPESHALVSEPILFHNVTSGTTSQSKFIPVTPRVLKALQRSQDLMVYLQQKAVPGAYAGKVLGIASPAEEGVNEHGITIGSASGRFYKNMPQVVASKYVVPYTVLEITDPEWKYYTVVLCALQHSDITYFATANPSTVLKLVSILNERRSDLWRDLNARKVVGLDARHHPLPDTIHACIRPTADRLAALQPLLCGTAPLASETLWPQLRLFSTWTGGSCGVALKAARHAFPASTDIIDLGYIASEIRATVTTDPIGQAGLPTFQDNFFEFVKKDAWENKRPQFLLLDTLEVGQEYYIFITTFGGLYRYNMNDIILVTGYQGECPLIRFVQKGKGVCNITGEKLYEGQVLQAIDTWGVACQHVQALADVEQARYVVYAELSEDTPSTEEASSRVLDDALKALNLEYRDKRNSGRLHALTCRFMKPGALQAIKAHAVASGQREGQFKTVLLQYRADLDFDFEAWSR